MRKYLLTSIFVLIPILLFADNYYGKRIGIDNGLSQASVTCITYNDDGALWIGTRFGLNEYSNGKIINFTKEKYGLSGCYINGLFCSPKDNTLWVSSERGLHTFDSQKGVFKSISSEPTNCVLEHNDTLFIGGHHGLLYYDKETDSTAGAESPIWTDILKLYSYDDSLLCIDRKNGVSLHKGLSKTPLDIDEIKGQTLMASFLDGDTLYLSILGEGVIAYDLKKRHSLSYVGGKKKELAIVLSIDKVDNDIWLGSDGEGIWVLKDVTSQPEKFEDLFSTNPGTEIPKAVTSIFQDPFGNIWIGGERFGITGLKSSTIRSFLTDETINYIYESKDKERIFVGTNGNGIYSYSSDYSSKRHLTATDGLKITAIADYNRNSIILCAYNQGFYLYDLTTDSLTPFVLVDTRTNVQECMFGNAPEIYRLPDGDLIFFAVHNYLHTPGSTDFIKMNANEDEYVSDLRVVYPDSATNHIYSYSRDGIFKIDVQECSIKKVMSYTNATGHINCISYNDTEFVFGTDYGLYRLNTEDYSYTHIYSSLFNRVTEVCFDKEGTLWLGADNALFKYENKLFSPIGENSGVAANEISRSILSHSGAVILGGSNGFLSINGKDHTIYSDATEKTIRLHEVDLDGKAASIHGETIRIPDKSKDLNVTISLLDADPLERIVYKYTVDGGASYSIETFEESFQVPIQKAGTYSLNVSYLKHNGKWSNPQTILHIKKAKPWFATNTAIACYIIVFTLLMILLVLYLRKKMLLELQANLEKRDQSFINKFEEYVEAHYSESDLTVDQIATALAMSRATLYIKAKESLSKGIGEYIEEKRMKEAQKLLKESKLSMAEIAEQVGYSTARYFSARFKIYTGVSPLAYRKKRLKGL